MGGEREDSVLQTLFNTLSFFLSLFSKDGSVPRCGWVWPSRGGHSQSEDGRLSGELKERERGSEVEERQ